MKVERYTTADGKVPFSEWLAKLAPVVRARVLANVARMGCGNLGDVKPIKGAGADGLYERRMFFGPGYRAYFGKDGDALVLLLCGGDKGSQTADVARAKRLWAEYKTRKEQET